LGLVVTASRPALAEELALALDYEAPAECLTAAALREQVGQLVTKPRTEPLSASVRIEGSGRSYRARIRTDASGERVLDGSSCEAVTDATAVILALALSPKRETDVAPEVTRSAPARSGPNDPLRFLLQLGLGGAVGPLPSAELGVVGGLGLEKGFWSTVVHGSYWLPRRFAAPQNAAQGGDFQWWTASAQWCVAPVRGTSRLALCLGPELGQMSAVGFGVSAQKHAQALWLGGLSAAEYSVSFQQHYRFRAALGAGVLLSGRHPFVLNQTETISRPSRVSGRAEMGWELVF
jgi:hypothetical protein